MTDYRKIYESFYGPIPKDENNRSYEIHHVDGNRNNNDISNLICVSIQEHYNIHYEQKDYGACMRIASRLQFSSEQWSELARKQSFKRLENGTHPFQLSRWDFPKGELNPVWKQIAEGKNLFTNGEMDKRKKERIKLGTYHSQSEKFKINSSRLAKEKVANGTHNFLGGEIQRRMNRRRLELGTHTTQQEWTCPHCNISGKGNSNASRWHFNNCKQRKV